MARRGPRPAVRLILLSAAAAAVSLAHAERTVVAAQRAVAVAAAAARPRRRRPSRAAGPLRELHGKHIGALLLFAMTPRASSTLRLDFEHLDENRDGFVDKIELMLGARDIFDESLGREDQETRRLLYRQAESLYHTCDLDGDGVLNPREVEYAAFSADAAARMSKKRQEDLSKYVFSGAGSIKLLRRVDADGDELVSEDEYWFGALADTDGAPPPGGDVARNYFRTYFDRADITGDGYLDAQELEYVSFLLWEEKVKKLADVIFGKMDTNLDGYLEWREVSENIPEGPSKLGSIESVWQYMTGRFSSADVDRDGKLDYFEVYDLMDSLLDHAVDGYRG